MFDEYGTEWFELGVPGVSYSKYVSGDDKHWSGVLVQHPAMSAEGRQYQCMGAVPFKGRGMDSGNRPVWDVISEEPLTLSPSILCSCGFHGWIREGRWVPA